MLTLNGRPVLSMRFTLPLSGLWVAALEVDSDDEIEGAVTLEQSDSPVSFSGYVAGGGVVAGLCKLEVVGGSGGLLQDVDARSYRDATAKDVAAELLAVVGESLDPSSSRSVTGTALPYWTRAAGRASAALGVLAGSLGARWRVLPSGATWLGADAWSAVSDLETLELDRDGPAGSVLIACDTIDLVPGVTLGADRVGRVEHYFGRGEPLRTTYWTAT